MPDILLVPTAIVYLLVVGALFAYGLNFLYLTWLSRRGDGSERVPPSPPEQWPVVTVQIPIYNELYVAVRVVKNAARIEYPRHLLEIQVLDDSTDETSQSLAQLVRSLRAEGIQVDHIQRGNRKGYKAGALAHGMERARGEFIAVFDADAVPPRDFLERTIPYFADPKLAFVQTRWGHLDREHSLFTRLQAIAIDAHFKVEQFARSRGGYLFNFNGTSGIWRRQAIEEAGGWRADTLTEDLDLSYRAFLKGWTADYVDDLEVPAELPASLAAYRRQQYRWARGSLECAVRLLPQIWSSALPLRVKLQSTFHLTGYGVHLLLLVLSILYPLVLALTGYYPGLITLFGIAIIFNITALAPTLLFLAGQKRLGRPILAQVPQVLFLSAMGTGMMVNTARAAFDILRRKPAAFERTPKFALVGRGQSWLEKKYQLRLDPIVGVELILAAFNGFSFVIAVSQGNGYIALYVGLFTIGLLSIAGLNLAQAIRVYQHGRVVRRAASAVES